MDSLQCLLQIGHLCSPFTFLQHSSHKQRCPQSQIMFTVFFRQTQQFSLLERRAENQGKLEKRLSFAGSDYYFLKQRQERDLAGLQTKKQASRPIEKLISPFQIDVILIFSYQNQRIFSRLCGAVIAKGRINSGLRTNPSATEKVSDPQSEIGECSRRNAALVMNMLTLDLFSWNKMSLVARSSTVRLFMLQSLISTVAPSKGEDPNLNLPPVWFYRKYSWLFLSY